MPRKKKVKQVTVPELQAFLTGAMEFNDDDWLPDVGQWKRIVEMIMTLKPEEKHVIVQNNSGRPLMGSDLDHTVDNPGHGNMVNDVEVQPSTLSESKAPKIDLRKPNNETMHSLADGKDENGVVSSGKKFKGPVRDDSDGLKPSEFL